MTVSTLMSSTRKTVATVLVTLVAATCLASAGVATSAVADHHADATHATKEWKKVSAPQGDVVLAASETKRKKEW